MKSGSRAWLAAVIVCIGGVPHAQAWNARGHRTVTLLALDGLPEGMPGYLRDPGVRARIAEQSTEPDRWRGTRAAPIAHEANTEHYIDVEDLAPYGLTLSGLPEHRYEYVRLMAVARDRNPGAFPSEGKDPDQIKDWPGFLPYAIAEHHAKLRSSFNSYRILEVLHDPARAEALEQERQNIISEMGLLGHYVGDAAQPLHTTRHHHGWVGENPGGYTTEHGFHAYIDGAVIDAQGLDFSALRPGMAYDLRVEGGAWRAGLEEIQRSFAQVEPLYRMKRDGSLEGAEGRAMLGERLRDGARTLEALYASAWEASAPTPGEISAFVRYSESGPVRPAPAPGDAGGGGAPAPATPAATPGAK
jgi:hypothetical protein